jgi:hypothetical protein
MSLVGIAFTTRNSKKINTVCITTTHGVAVVSPAFVNKPLLVQRKILITKKSEYQNKQHKRIYLKKNTNQTKQTSKFIFEK